jgi:hypothetical protein
MSDPTRGGGLRAPLVIRGYDSAGVLREYSGTDIREIVFDNDRIVELDTTVTPPRLMVNKRPALPS